MLTFLLLWDIVIQTAVMLPSCFIWTMIQSLIMAMMVTMKTGNGLKQINLITPLPKVSV